MLTTSQVLTKQVMNANKRSDSLKRTSSETDGTSTTTSRQYEWTRRVEDKVTDRTGTAVGGNMEWQGHTYRGGSAGYAHKSNRN